MVQGGTHCARSSPRVLPQPLWHPQASCCDSFLCGFSMGCNGGQPGMALQWMTWTGVVTGGGYGTRGDGHTCQPYTLPPCAHHVPANAK